MKRIIFYSFNGTHTSVLFPLLLKKPKNVTVDWFVQEPVGRFSEYIDAITSIKELGVKVVPFSKSPVHEAIFQAIQKRRAIIYESRHKKLFLNSKRAKNAKVYSFTGDIVEILKNRKYDGLIIPTLHVSNNLIEYFQTSKIPCFFHAYGNTFKHVSGFDLYPERARLMATIFHHGSLEYEQTRFIETRHVISGASFTDLLFEPHLFRAPKDKPFAVYFNTISKVDIYPDELSEPEKWAGKLKEICQKANLELVIKLHPNTLKTFYQSHLSEMLYPYTYRADILRQASVIIGDASSIMAEALLVNKPLFLLNSPLKEWEYLRIFKRGCRVFSGNVKRDFRLLAQELQYDTYAKARNSLKSKWWHKPDGNTSRRIWRNILNII